MPNLRRSKLIVSFACLSVAALSVLSAQERLSDKDLESMMRNLRDDAKAFREPFASALKRSAIRKTSEEKSARSLSESFATQCEGMLNSFKRDRKANQDVVQVISSAQRIDGYVNRLRLYGDAQARWTRIRGELGNVATAFNVSDQYKEAFATTGSGSAGVAAGDVSCLQGVGAERASRLVEECTSVSPATHPPCNAQNSCQMIIDEIKRGCALLDRRSAPNFCNEYR